VHLFRDLSIKRKQMLVIMLTSTATLLVASVAFLAYEFITFRDQLTREASTLAGIIGEYSKDALAFDDSEAAEETLAALVAEEQIVSAAIYTNDRELFAQYSRDETAASPSSLPLEAGTSFESDHLDMVRGIFLDEERIGSVYLQLGFESFYSRMRRDAGIVVVILLASIVAIPANEIVIPTILMLTVLSARMAGVGEGPGVMFEPSESVSADVLRAGGWTLLTAVNAAKFEASGTAV